MTASFTQIQEIKDSFSSRFVFDSFSKIEILKWFAIFIFPGIILQNLFLAALAFATLSLLFFIDRIKIRYLKNYINGELSFSNDKICWNEPKNPQAATIIVLVDDIQTIDLQYAKPLEFKSYLFGFNRESEDEQPFASLKIELKSGESHQIHFAVQSKGELEQLSPIWKSYYIRKIKIKERLFDMEYRTYLFKQKPTAFADIQELKKELNLDTVF